MICPHTVSLMNYLDGSWHLTVLRSVMLQSSEKRNVLQRGDRDTADAVLFIPDFSGFLPPREYAVCPAPESHWTLNPEGESAGRASFFVKGELSAPVSLAEARETLDYIYVVAGYSIHDYGSARMRHIEVRSRVSARYYYDK